MNDNFLEELIQLDDSEQVKKWSLILKCREEDLIDAVLKVGKSAKTVNVFLELNRKKIE